MNEATGDIIYKYFNCDSIYELMGIVDNLYPLNYIRFFWVFRFFVYQLYSIFLKGERHQLHHDNNTVVTKYANNWEKTLTDSILIVTLDTYNRQIVLFGCENWITYLARLSRFEIISKISTTRWYIPISNCSKCADFPYPVKQFNNKSLVREKYLCQLHWCYSSETNEKV